MSHDTKPKKVKAVMYHNLFGEFSMPKFNTVQANIFMYILYKLKGMVKDADKLAYYQSHPNEFYIKVTSDEALKEFRLKRNNKPNIDKALKFMRVLKHTGFKSISDNGDSITYNTLFVSTRYTKSNNQLKLHINPTSNMIPMFREFSKGNFTKFALIDYCSLKSVYEKALFRYLSRFVTAKPIHGKHQVRIKKYKLYGLLNISKNSTYYTSGNIKSTILDKAIKPLRYYFKDLSVKCTYNHSNLNVYYDFTWTDDLRTKISKPNKIDNKPGATSSEVPDDLLPF